MLRFVIDLVANHVVILDRHRQHVPNHPLSIVAVHWTGDVHDLACAVGFPLAIIFHQDLGVLFS